MIREVQIDDNEPESEDWSCYRLNLTNDVVIDIPREMSDLKNYSASLGHKVRTTVTIFCNKKSNFCSQKSR